MATIAVFNIHVAGHVGPSARLSGVLVRQGHRVIAWGPEANRGQFEAAGAQYEAHAPAPNPGAHELGFSAALAEATERCIGDVIERLHRSGVDLVIHDRHVPWARLAGDFLGLPRIICEPRFPAPMPPAPAPGTPPVLWPRADRALALVAASRSALMRAWGIDLGDWHHATYNTAPATVSFTTERIAGPDMPASADGWTYVGPLLQPFPSPPLRTGAPLVYVAFGTSSNDRPDLFKTAIAAISPEPVDVLVSTGGGVVDPADLGPLPSNVTVHRYVSAREVLARTSVHVTHGGCSSVHESLIAAVPMVCIPQAFDQIGWCKRVEAIGAGPIVDETPEAIGHAVRQLLRGGEARMRARQAAEHLCAYDGERRAGELIGRTLA